MTNIIVWKKASLLLVLRLLVVVVVLSLSVLPNHHVAEGCNRFYTSTAGGKSLTRINRRTGKTRDFGRWQKFGNVGGDRIIDSIEYNFPRRRMFGLELDEGRPGRAQRFVRVNRRLPKGANVNNVTFGVTGRFDLKGLAVDGNDKYYTHSLETQTLYEINPNTGALTELFVTGLGNVLDLGYKIDTGDIWAVTGTQIFIINLRTESVTIFEQRFVQNNPDNRIVAIAFNPVRHNPVTLTQGEPNANPVVLPSIYNFFLTNGQEELQGVTNITDGIAPRGGTIQCKLRVFTQAPSAAPPTNSPVPTAAPSADPRPSLQLDPFRVTLQYPAGNTVNETALQGNIQGYLLEQQNRAIVASMVLTPQQPNSTATARRQRRRRRGLQEETLVEDYSCRAALLVSSINDAQAASIRTAFFGSVENDAQMTAAVNGNGNNGTNLFVGSPSNVQATASAAIVSSAPSLMPSLEPSSTPSLEPSSAPSLEPSSMPSNVPSSNPSAAPSAGPSAKPSSVPTTKPSAGPSLPPTTKPSARPSAPPSGAPSRAPSPFPSSRPSAAPSFEPSAKPTAMPSHKPSSAPSPGPSAQPSARPTSHPSNPPSPGPSSRPSIAPTSGPSVRPSQHPSKEPTSAPSSRPSIPPSNSPSKRPSVLPSTIPTGLPSNAPVALPTTIPSGRPSLPPSSMPSADPLSVPSALPSTAPSLLPSKEPSNEPSSDPSASPTASQLPSSRPV